MADVTVEIAGRAYRVGCDDGEEAHLVALAHDLDAVARRLVAGMSQTPEEPRLLLMVALMMADRAREAEAAANGRALEQAADRITALAERIESAARGIGAR